jgi:hypothetical protein
LKRSSRAASVALIAVLAAGCWGAFTLCSPAPVAAQDAGSERRASRAKAQERKRRLERKRARASARRRARERAPVLADVTPDSAATIAPVSPPLIVENPYDTQRVVPEPVAPEPTSPEPEPATPDPAQAAPTSESQDADPRAPELAQTTSLPALRAVRTARAPEIDGVIGADEWSAAQPAERFTQKAPHGGQAASERTILRVLYDDDSLYVAFDCVQVHSPVVALLARRDRPLETDSVTIALDTRAEGRSAFEFTVTAAGVLIDGIRYDDGKIAREWDEVWEASSALRSDGWSAELRIPLRTLRFEPARDAVWGMQARRYVSARQESDEWAYAPAEAGGVVSRFGRLEGLQNVEPDHAFALRPFVLGRARHQQRDPAIVHEGWQLEPSAGLDFTWRPAENLALDGTINPDFAQVEADRLILNLSTIEVAFPEKRPFFLAGMDDFATLAPIFYSRRIGRSPKAPVLAEGERLYERPQPSRVYGALKLASDISGGTTLAALSAVTAPNRVDAVLADDSRAARLVDPLTAFNVVRVRTELAPRLDVGALATATNRIEPNDLWPTVLTSDATYAQLFAPGEERASSERCPRGEIRPLGKRCFHDAYVGSLDLVWRSPAGDYALRAQGYGSAIANGEVRTLADGTQIDSGDLGAGGTLRISKQGGGHWLLDGTVTAHSHKLDFNDLGFMDRQNDVRAGAYVEFRTLEPWLVLLETHTSLLAHGQINLDGLPLGRGAMLMEHLVFDGGSTLTLGGYAEGSRFDDREVGDGSALERTAMLGAMQALSSDPRWPVVVAAQATQERRHNGASFSAQLDLVWRPLSMLELQVSPAYSESSGEPRYAGAGMLAGDMIFGHLLARSAGATLRASYAFSPTLSLQSYAQLFVASGEYSDFSHFLAPPGGPRPVVELRDLAPSPPPAIRPDFERASLALNVVLRWEYRIGSTLYLLYARSQDPDVVLQPWQRPRLVPDLIRTAPASDVLMLKLAYWLG